MTDQPDMRFDIDALFEHMTGNLGHELQNELDWNFSLQSPDFQALQNVADELEPEYLVQLHESIQEIDSEGNHSEGDPLLCVIQRAALTPDEVKALANRLNVLAEERGLSYEGVSCYEPINEEELLGWQSLDDACWQLRNATGSGLELNAELPWTFLVVVPDLDGMQNIARELEALGFDDRDDYHEPDEQGLLGVCAFVEGRNNEFDLRETTEKIRQVAERHGGQLEGIQFYTRDDMYDVFGVEEDV
ncbi:hypothetical protein Pan153_00290 [Gimesia panareensis]|uniref:Regulator of ribonuclease activity B domain-containing protein n=1 Tax=Gimesia panareensis TaxID=2527978 RepID=A0A518FGF3_9PLAN|nr:ribonuclease E inhibitor RraB [Gimesia panareensis]QDV15415.1 hypothetical protein Pan153_00290 [Gimesia panareensis]